MSTSNCNGASKSNNDNDVLGNMSFNGNNNDNGTNTCANCGKKGSDVINTCNKCKSVMYCNAACKKKHRHKYKKHCEEHLRLAAEQAAKLHDEKLFKQPPLPFDDCPICFLRMPSLISGSVYMTCCGKVICYGCIHAVQTRTEKHSLCAFCRTPNPNSNEDDIIRLEKRVKLGDALAMYNIGGKYFNGDDGFPQNYIKALELWHQAGELGYAPAYTNIGACYDYGLGVQIDKKKAQHYFELSAMAGNEVARNNLGVCERKAGNIVRAIKHFTIAAEGGEAESVKNIQNLFLNGYATKEDYTKALFAYQSYLREIRSAQRDEAAAFDDDYKYIS